MGFIVIILGLIILFIAIGLVYRYSCNKTNNLLDTLLQQYIATGSNYYIVDKDKLRLVYMVEIADKYNAKKIPIDDGNGGMICIFTYPYKGGNYILYIEYKIPDDKVYITINP